MYWTQIRADSRASTPLAHLRYTLARGEFNQLTSLLIFFRVVKFDIDEKEASFYKSRLEKDGLAG